MTGRWCTFELNHIRWCVLWLGALCVCMCMCSTAIADVTKRDYESRQSSYSCNAHTLTPSIAHFNAQYNVQITSCCPYNKFILIRIVCFFSTLLLLLLFQSVRCSAHVFLFTHFYLVVLHSVVLLVVQQQLFSFFLAAQLFTCKLFFWLTALFTFTSYLVQLVVVFRFVVAVSIMASLCLFLTLLITVA